MLSLGRTLERALPLPASESRLSSPSTRIGSFPRQPSLSRCGPYSNVSSLLSSSIGFNIISKRHYHLLPRTLEQMLEALLKESVEKTFPGVEMMEKMYSIATSPIGDYRTSIAFQIAHKVKRKPSEVAKALADAMNESTAQWKEPLKEISATGQGFVSFTFSTAWLAHQSIHKDAHKLKALQYTTPRRIIIDHGSPNMSKEFHVGHLRSILIGDCLARVLKYQGHHVDTASHVGDFGTPMGLVIAQAMRTRTWASADGSLTDDLPSPPELSELYTEAKLAQKSDPTLQTEISRCVAEIQRLPSASSPPPDAHIKRVYDKICVASRKGFDDVYKDLNVTIPEVGESYYAPFIPSTIQELKDKNLLSESEGALVCQLDSWKAPLLVEKSDKTWLYGTTDLACLRHRLLDGKYDELLYVVDFTQNQHFEQVFEVGRKAGWYDPSTTRVEHVHFGVVQGANGQKLSSRDGTPMKLRQLLDDAIVETKSALVAARSLVRSDREDQEAEPISMEEKMTEPSRIGHRSGTGMDETTASPIASPASLALAEENAPFVAFNAIKYFELSQTRTQNYIFAFHSMLSFKGNTSFYIIYAYARIHTLYRRAQEQGVTVPELADDQALHMTQEELDAITPKERDLCLKLLQFPDVIRTVETSLMPHTLSAHLFHIAQKFHSFYESCRVIGSTNQDFRFKLCKATEQTLHIGMDLLNVHHVNRV